MGLMNLYYRFKFGLPNFNCNVDEILDKALNDCLDCGIKSVRKVNDEYLCIYFLDGTEYTFDNNRKYDYNGWLKFGEFKFNNDNKYDYKHRRPTVKTMHRFRKALKNFNYCQRDAVVVEKEIQDSLSEIPTENK